MLKYRVIAFGYAHFAKPIFFRFDPEFVHDLITLFGSMLGAFPPARWFTRQLLDYRHPMLEQTVAGLKFRNPVGLSAGFDKNAKLIGIIPAVGFGHAEVGSVTFQPYAGNPQPRLYRLVKSKALVVYYGLMNDGVRRIVSRIQVRGGAAHLDDTRIGISVAKTNSIDTATTEGGVQDYYECLNYLQQHDVGDYYTVNISCPNTFGGEPFTTKERLSLLLARVAELQIAKPLFVKMPINLPLAEFDELLDVCVEYKMRGVVIGNLTKVRDQLIVDAIPEHVRGGISGKPTEELCNQLIAHTYKRYSKELIIVGVGGTFSAEDAYRKIKNGATLLQLITGMVFQGPQLIGQINHGLVELLRQDGYQNVSQAVGSGISLSQTTKLP